MDGVLVRFLCQCVLPRTSIYIYTSYVYTSNLLHQLRSLRSVVLPDAINSPANVGTVNPSQRKKRITFLFLEAVSQILYMGLLVRV